MELDSESDSDDEEQIKLPEDEDNTEHHRHISKLEQSDCQIVEEVNLEEEDSESVRVPVGTEPSEAQKDTQAKNKQNCAEEDLEK